jgi:hypothetical protein
MNVHERLDLFYRRLRAAPAAAGADEAMSLVCKMIEEVENEFCPLPPEEPPPLRFTGRMYAPRSDRIRRLPGGGLVASTRLQRIYCGPDGAISIVQVADRKSILHKPGKKI